MGETAAVCDVQYSKDKPKDCAFCYYWQGRRKGCLLGEQDCAYLIREKPAKYSRCDGCPYGMYAPCIGWCTVDVINAVFRNRLAARNEASGGELLCQSSG